MTTTTAYDLVETKRKVLEDIRPEHRVIQLPEDQARRSKLEAKLEEYRQRSKDPVMQSYWLDTLYKLEFLEEVFQQGRVDMSNYLDTHPEILSMARGAFAPFFFRREYDTFCNTVFVIADYCRTGGEHTFQPVSPLRIED